MADKKVIDVMDLKIKDKVHNLKKLHPAVFVKFKEIYKKHLTGWTNQEIADEYGYSYRSINRAIEYMAIATDVEFASDSTAVKIERDRIDSRLRELEEFKDEFRDEDARTYLAAMREIRNNQELRMKLDGLLKLKLETEVDNKTFVVVHHVDRPPSNVPQIRSKGIDFKIIEASTPIEDRDKE